MTDRAPRPEGMCDERLEAIAAALEATKGAGEQVCCGRGQQVGEFEIDCCYQPDYIVRFNFDDVADLISDNRRLRADGATLKVRADEAHAAHSASFGALATLSAALFDGEVDDYAALAEKIIARVKQAEADGATLRERFAEFIAKWAHDGQKDKSGHSYIEHLMRVVNRLGTPEQRVLGWLHDTLEDTMLQAPTIEAHFGADVLDAVRWLTREKDRPYANYIARMVHAAPRDVLMVKRADLLDHLRPDSDFAMPDSLRDRYRFALAEIEYKLASAPKEPTP